MICNKCGNNIELGSSVCKVCGNTINVLTGESIEQTSTLNQEVVPQSSVVPTPSIPLEPISQEGAVSSQNISVDQNVSLEPSSDVNTLEQVPIQSSNTLVEELHPQEENNSIEKPLISLEALDNTPPISTSSVSVQPSGELIEAVNQDDENNSSSIPKILLCFVVIGIIALAGISIKNLFSKGDNNSSNGDMTLELEILEDESTTSKGTTTSKKAPTFDPLPSGTITNTTKKSDNKNFSSFKDFNMYIPDGFTTSTATGGTLQYDSLTKRQLIIVDITYLSFEEMDSFFGQSIDEMIKYGFKVTTPRKLKDYKGVRYSIVEGNMNGVSLATGCIDFIPGYIILFSYRSDLSSETAYLETIYQIVKNSKKTSSSDKTNDSTSNVSSFLMKVNNIF